MEEVSLHSVADGLVKVWIWKTASSTGVTGANHNCSGPCLPPHRGVAKAGMTRRMVKSVPNRNAQSSAVSQAKGGK